MVGIGWDRTEFRQGEAVSEVPDRLGQVDHQGVGIGGLEPRDMIGPPVGELVDPGDDPLQVRAGPVAADRAAIGVGNLDGGGGEGALEGSDEVPGHDLGGGHRWGEVNAGSEMEGPGQPVRRDRRKRASHVGTELRPPVGHGPAGVGEQRAHETASIQFEHVDERGRLRVEGSPARQDGTPVRDRAIAGQEPDVQGSARLNGGGRRARAGCLPSGAPDGDQRHQKRRDDGSGPSGHSGDGTEVRLEAEAPGVSGSR